MNNLFKIEELCSGLFSDSLDELGYHNQIVNGYNSNLKTFRILGRARTLKIETIKTDDENIKQGLTFIGDLKHDEILVVEGSNEFAYFGEMMTRLSVRQEIAGVVISGLTRDTIYTHDKCDLPIIAKGYSPVDIKGRGRVEATDVRITIENVVVNSGDLIFADSDAIVIVPKEVENKVYNLVMRRIDEEKRIIELINSGTSISEMLKSVKEF